MHISQQATSHSTQAAGIRVSNCEKSACVAYFAALGIADGLALEPQSGATHCKMSGAWMQVYAPDSDTLSLHEHAHNLQQEILWSMLVSPYLFEFGFAKTLCWMPAKQPWHSKQMPPSDLSSSGDTKMMLALFCKRVPA
jgi:hypothetical protein